MVRTHGLYPCNLSSTLGVSTHGNYSVVVTQLFVEQLSSVRVWLITQCSVQSKWSGHQVFTLKIGVRASYRVLLPYSVMVTHNTLDVVFSVQVRIRCQIIWKLKNNVYLCSLKHKNASTKEKYGEDWSYRRNRTKGYSYIISARINKRDALRDGGIFIGA